MSFDRFQKVVTSADELSILFGAPSELVIKKQLSELDDHMKSFLAKSPFLLLGSYGADGKCDVSPRGDTPSVANVLDSRTLVIADRPGNRRFDSLCNIIATGQVALLFLIPGLGETLRINGTACVLRDDDVLASLTAQGKQPVLGIAVEVEECYFQCAKSLIRAQLWKSGTGGSESHSLRFAEVLLDQTNVPGETVESLEEQIEQSYRERLY